MLKRRTELHARRSHRPPLPPALVHGRLALAPLCTLALAALGGCATGLRIDTQYSAQSQASRVQQIVLHYTVGNFPSALKTLTQGPVSSHYLVAQEPPTIYQLVSEDRRAFHAGISSWAGVTGLNSTSVGIEIVNAGWLDERPRSAAEPVPWTPGRWEPFPPAQVQAVIALVRDIQQRHQVKPHLIVGHSDIAPARKLDPGPLFPWPQLHAAGLVPWPDAAQVAVAQAALAAQPLPDAAWFQQRFNRLGFALPSTGHWDNPTRDVMVAFQTKYRPRLFNGKPDAETAALLQVATTPGGLLMVGPDGRTRPYQP